MASRTRVGRRGGLPGAVVGVAGSFAGGGRVGLGGALAAQGLLGPFGCLAGCLLGGGPGPVGLGDLVAQAGAQVPQRVEDLGQVVGERA